LLCVISTHLDASNKFNYIFSSYFKQYDIADSLLSLFTLLPFSSFKENVNNDDKFNFLSKSYSVPLTHYIIVLTAICIGCSIDHFLYDLYRNNPNFNINNITDINIVKNKYYVIFNFLQKISKNPSSYYYYFQNKQNNNFPSSFIQILKNRFKNWKEMSNEYERTEKIKKINKFI
jgi:hypothetical protein